MARKPKKPDVAKMESFILLDRTGSMQGKWTEAVRGVNAYVKNLDGQADNRVTLVVFDLHNGVQFDVLRHSVAAKDWTDFREEEAPPRGLTPLLDALVRICAMAEQQNCDKTVLVVMTDGEENSSREATKDTAKAALDRMKSKGWQVVFLGADFDAFGQAMTVGVLRGQTISVTPQNLSHTMGVAAFRATSYLHAGSDMAWTDEDRDSAGEKKIVKPRR